MDQLFYLIKKLLLVRGAIFCLLIVMVFIFFPLKIIERISKLFSRLNNYFVTILFLFFIFIGVCYLFYPNFFDHVESTIASIGTVMKKGDSLYPNPEPYPYHGILYGPALAEIQGTFNWTGLSTIVKSKLPGFIAFLFSTLILFRISKCSASRGYLLYLLPFGGMLFWNRPEPFLLLIVSLSILLGQNLKNKVFLSIILGAFAGAASALKIQGFVYVFAVYIAITFSKFISIQSIILFSFFSLLSFLTFFIPQNISINAYFYYLKSSSIHGLSLRIWIDNAIYLLFLLLPFFFYYYKAKLEKVQIINLFLIFGIELFVSILGSKPGAGAHHLLPFIPTNAIIFRKLLSNENSVNKQLVNILYFSLIIPSFVAALSLVLPMINGWDKFDRAKNEVIYFESKYPGIIMGLADDSTYSYTFLRVILANTQIDYPAFMDLQYSGIGDYAFAKHFRNRRIESVLIPNGGIPFSMNNPYTSKPLFSDSVRQVFSENYICVKIGEYFTVYSLK